MNQDFGLLLTPSNARRLLILQHTCNVVLPDLAELAKQDKIDDSDFDQFVCPASDTRIEITQFLLDCNLRGIIQQNYHPEIDEIAIFNSIRLAKPEFVTVFSVRSDVWRNAAKAFFLDDVTKVCKPFDLQGEEIDSRRSGVLIIDNDPYIESNLIKVRDYSNEFARTIVFDCQKEWNLLVPWPVWAHTLFPTMPTPLYPRIVSNVSETYNSKPLYRFAPLYNVCLFPDLISDQIILNQLADRVLHPKLMRHIQYLNVD